MHNIFFAPRYGIWKCLFADVIASGQFEKCYFSINRLGMLLLSARLLKRVPHRVKRLLFRHVLRYNFLKVKDNSTSFMFVFTNGFEMFSDDYLIITFLDFLKKEYKNCKIALHDYESRANMSHDKIEKIAKRFDLIYTFNFYDSVLHGMTYYGGVCEYNSVAPTGDAEYSDCFYAGGTSANGCGRIEMVMDVFVHLSRCGKKCIFYLNTQNYDSLVEYLIAKHNGCHFIFDKGQRMISYKKSYIINRYLPYSNMLSFILKTTAVLEVLLPVNFATSTCRQPLAMGYSKKIITNCSWVSNEPFFHPENVFIFHQPNDIDIEFFKKSFIPLERNFTALHMIEEMKKQLLPVSKISG